MTSRNVWQKNLLQPVSMALAVLSGMCAAKDASAQAGSAEAAGVEAAQVPELHWSACDADSLFECATAIVPLDYADPRGRTIELALNRLPAADAAQRIGSLFVNPGGPGASGVDFVFARATTGYSEEIRARFDIVGFDPRFVGRSRPARCVTQDEEFELFGADFKQVPVTPAEEAVVHQSYARYSQLCAERMPDLQYAATANVARDLELLRRAVGDERLSYAGYSYGTVLGQTYAALYPNDVRAILLDGVADAEAWSGTPQTMSTPYWSRTGAAVGAAEALQEFFRLCREAGLDRCPLARYGDPATVFAQLADAMRAGPLPNLDSTFDYSWLVRSALGALYVPSTWDMFSYMVARLWTYAFLQQPDGEDAASLEQVEQARRAAVEDDA